MVLTALSTENRAGRPLARTEVMTASEVAELLHPPALTASTSHCAMRSRGPGWSRRDGS